MQLSLSSIWPNFGALFSDIGSSEGISALFWVAEVAVFAYFAVYLLRKASDGFSSVADYQKMLKGLTRNDLVTRQRELRAYSFKTEEAKNLWLEFDETLVACNNGEHLYNTYDAAHFFNTHSLASKATESRLLAAVPGFLTAIGVIGTFLGLQLGLGALNLNTSDSEQLKAAISALISSASIAFMTSVWGVFLSLLFNAIEKIVEGKIRSRIGALQQRIDELFPRLIAEQTLLDISRDGHQSKETLMGLAEQIGNRMQTAVQSMAETVTNGMADSLRQIMTPAIEQMVEASTEFANKQANSSEDALKGLLDKFMDGMGQAGTQQQVMMQEASHNMNHAMGEWSSGLTQFMGQLNLTISRLEDMSEQQGKALNEQISASLNSQKENTDYATGQMKSMAENLMDSVKSHHQQVADTEQQRLAHLTQHMENSTRIQADDLKKITDSSHAAAEEFQSSVRQGMEMMMADYQSRQLSIADGDAQRQQAMDEKIAQLTDSVNVRFGQLMEQFATLQRSGAEADLERQSAMENKVAQLTEMVNGSFGQLLQQFGNQQKEREASDLERQNAMDNKVAQLTEMVNGSFGQLLQQLNDQQQSAVASDIERQGKLVSELESFIQHQKNEFGNTLKQAESVNEHFAQAVQSRINNLVAQDQQRDLEIRGQLEDMRGKMAQLVDDMRRAMEGHIQSVHSVVQQAQVLNEGIHRNQLGLNNAADNIEAASVQMQLTSENLHRSHQEVSRATDGISGTLGLAASAVTKTSQQNAVVAESLQSTLNGLEKLRDSLTDISDDIRYGAENAENASRELATNHARYREEMKESIGILHEQLSGLLTSYAKQVQDQTVHRMEEWNRHTQEYVTGMMGVVSVMQELVDDMDHRRRAA